MIRLIVIAILGSISMVPASAEDAIVGFRGNWTGRFPDASPPIEWHKVSKFMAGLRCQAEKPEGDKPTGVSMHSGSISEWLILGPVPSEGLKDEGNWQPAAGEQVKGKTWEKFVPKDSAVSTPALSAMIPDANTVYLHSYLYSPQEGALRFHHYEGKAKLAGMYVNGAAVVPGRETFKYYGGGSIKVRKGWNRLLLKLTGKPLKGKGMFRYPKLFALHPELLDFSFGFRTVKPESFAMKNIVWATRLPNKGPASPVIVGDDVFVMADPGDLICLDKKSGKIKWIRSTTFYDVADEKERKENPAFKEVAELVKKLRQFNRELEKSGGLPQSKLNERVGKSGIYGKIIAGMRKIDESKYYSHISHTGNVVPTPVSDGKHIYFRLDCGIAACFDLKGNRQWTSSSALGYKIRDLGHGTLYGRPRHGFNGSVALIGGNLLVPRDNLTAFNAVTGKLVWRVTRDTLGMNNKFSNIYVTPLSLDIGGKEYICFCGRIIDPANGKVLWDKWPRTWVSTSVPAGGALFSITKHSGTLFSRVEVPGKLSGLAPASKKLGLFSRKVPSPKGRSIPNSLLIHDGLAYVTDVMGTLYVIDTKTCSLVYRKSLRMGPEWGNTMYTLGTVFCSPVLAGKYIYFFATNGTTVAIEPGRTYKEVARNKIEDDRYSRRQPTKIESFVSTPVAEGGRLYIRGDKYLYCIGETEEAE